jgi:hypothetical protein
MRGDCRWSIVTPATCAAATPFFNRRKHTQVVRTPAFRRVIDNMPTMRQPILILAACIALATAGCTHVQLEKNTVNEAYSVGDLEQQQVLNNLAMFVYNYNSMPYFSFPNQGATVVTDQGNAGVTAAWGRPITSGGTATSAPKKFGDFLLTAIGMSGSAQRSNQESFVLTPINDPRKLELMRCAYQIAVSSCGYGTPARNCPDCQARFNTFYTGDPDGNIRDSAAGTITSECLKSNFCWFCSGCEKQVPKHCPCQMVGHYCGVYVWVPPEGRDELTRLTLAILDYALHEPPVRLTKEIIYYVDDLGLPTLQKDAVGTVRATVAINERSEALINISAADELRIEQQLDARLKALRARLAEVQAASKAKPDEKPAPGGAAKGSSEESQLLDAIDLVEHKLQFLDSQLNHGGIREQFYRGGVAPPPFSVIPQLLQQQNALGAPATLPTPQ